MGAQAEAAPLLEVQLELAAPDVVWKPELGGDVGVGSNGSGGAGVRDMVQSWLLAFMEVRLQQVGQYRGGCACWG